MSDKEDIKIMLARAVNITERTLDRFAGDHWGPTETDYARKLIADLAAALATRPEPLYEGLATGFARAWPTLDFEIVVYPAAAGSATPQEDTDD